MTSTGMTHPGTTSPGALPSDGTPLAALRASFERTASEIDTALLQWLTDPGHGRSHGLLAASLLGRLGSAARGAGLKGLAIVMELLRDSLQLMAGFEGDELAEAHDWITRWHPPVAASLAAPGQPQATADLAEFLLASPVPPTRAQVDELCRLLAKRGNDAPPEPAAAPVPSPSPSTFAAPPAGESPDLHPRDLPAVPTRPQTLLDDDIVLPAPSAVPPATAPVDERAGSMVAAGTFDQLVRRAAQALMHHGRIDELWRQADTQLAAWAAAQRRLDERLEALDLALDRHVVHVQGREGGQGDPLELDRCQELQTLSRFASEAAAEARQQAQGAREAVQSLQPGHRSLGQQLNEQHRELLAARLVPVQSVADRLRRGVALAAAAAGRPVRLQIDGEAVMIGADVLDRLVDPLLHLLRNAVQHGIESADERDRAGKPAGGTVRLQFSQEPRRVRVICEDDGRGVDLAAVRHRAETLGLVAPGAPASPSELLRLLLLPGFSTREAVTPLSGRGVGLDFVADRVRAMLGRIELACPSGSGLRITLSLPASGNLLHALIVEAGGHACALPSESVSLALAAGQGEIVPDDSSGATRVFRYASRTWPCHALAGWLGAAPALPAQGPHPVVLVHGADGEIALQVERIVDSRELVLQDIGPVLRRLRGLAGGTVRSDGSVVFVLDLPALERAAGAGVDAAAAPRLAERARARRHRVLVVDDTASARQAIGQVLRDAGHEVELASDGQAALELLIARPADLVISDLEMPGMDGLALTRRLRASRLWAQLPVVIVSAHTRDADVQSAGAAGANVFLGKPYADEDLLAEVQHLLASTSVPG